MANRWEKTPREAACADGSEARAGTSGHCPSGNKGAENSAKESRSAAVTIRDIARACGVGLATVSRALNNSEGVSKATRKRVLAAAAALNYSPNPYAKGLRTVTSSTVVVLMKGPDNPFFLEFLGPLELAIRQHGLTMTIVRVPHSEDEVQLALRTCAVSKPEGVIFLGGWYRHDRRLLEDIPVPFVMTTISSLDDTDKDSYSSVRIDEEAGMELIADHLIGLGHREFAVLGPDLADRSVGAQRLTALFEACERRGVHIDPDLVLNGEVALSPYSLGYGYELAKRLVARGKCFTALVNVSDVIAIGAQRALIESGISVPEEVSVTGFDGIDLSRYTSPSITTVVQPVEEIVAQTCEILFGLIGGTGEPRHEVVAPVLRIGESTAAASV
ncbi:MAG: LacI family DNA-binding transcriptional regulator [Actinomycetaceae bacterium]|nr:LacI family DNA-binding transcriptional regulator [Actinomycetaceae bacterium]MDY5854335.1 LacI family DNA-binding transcriptional regulator [Arcanobacterium sp.]